MSVRKILILSVLVFTTTAACGRSWRATTRADWRSLDCVARRMAWIVDSTDDPDVRECARIVLLHVAPMLARHGGTIHPDDALVIDDPALVDDGEAALIMAQHGYAHSAANLNDILEQLVTVATRRARGWVRSALWASLPWGLVVLLVWWFMFRRARGRDRALAATFARVRELAPNHRTRAEHFGDDPDIRREYARLRPRI